MNIHNVSSIISILYSQSEIKSHELHYLHFAEQSCWCHGCYAAGVALHRLDCLI